MSDARGPVGDTARPERRPDRDDDAPVLPSRPDHESDAGWGDAPSERDEDWYRRERPPHHE